MALAETARLLAQYDFKDNSAAGVSSALGGVNRLNTGVSKFASNLKGGASTALTTFSGRLRGAASAGLGLLGVGGLFSVAAAFKESLGEAQSFGAEVIRLSGLTGLATEKTSELAGALHHFGIDADTAQRLAGLAEKNLGNLTKTAQSAAKFQKDYGLSLVDSAGHAKDFNTLLLDTADFFNNKAIPAQTKAAGLAKIFGRSWQDLIPILSAGRKGIADAEEEAKQLGLTLTDENIVALKQARDASRDWTTALGGLKLQIGLNILPVLTDLAKAATKFVSEHRLDIVTFFKNTIQFGRNAASAIGEFAGQVAGAWNSIPPAMRDFLVKGLVADRTLKFLFGISPIQIVAKLAEGALGGVASGLGNALIKAGVGKAFVQPVFVVNQVGGVPSGAAPAGVAGAAKTGISTLGKLFLVGEAIGLIAAVNAVRESITTGLTQQTTDIHTAVSNQINATKPDLAALAQSMAGVDQGIEALSHDPIGNALLGDQIGQLQKIRSELSSRLVALDDQTKANFRQSERDDATHAAVTKQAIDRSRDATEAARIAIASGITRTSAKVGDLVRTEAGQTSRIVTAIRQNRPIVKVNVDINAVTKRYVVRYQTGGSIGRSTGGPTEFN